MRAQVVLSVAGVAAVPDWLLPVVHRDAHAPKLGAKFSGVEFTHCGTGDTCGGHQTCSNYELALSDANIWNALVGIPMSGGYDHCPGGNWEDCCQGSTAGVCDNLPACPLDGKDAKDYPVCVKAPNGQQQTAYVTGCCPSRHPCNICKTELGQDGGCSADKDQADLCDNLWQALGSPSQDNPLEITVGSCDSVPEDDEQDTTTTTTTTPKPAPPTPSPETCRTCLTMCAPCKACTGGKDGTFPFGNCEKCWKCWDWDDDELEDDDDDMDAECDAMHKKHEWNDEEVRCITDHFQDCRVCWGESQQMLV